VSKEKADQKAFDEDYYDLDDDFIDDGDVDYLEDIQKGGQLDHSPFSELDEEDSISGDEDQHVKRLLKDFRVLNAFELAEMEREEEARMKKLKEKLGQVPVSSTNKTPKKSGSDGEATDTNITTNRKRKRNQMTEEESSSMQAVFVEMTQIQMNTGDASMAKFDKQIDKLVKLLLDNDPQKNAASAKFFDSLMENVSYRLGDFFHKPQEEMCCLLKKKFLKKKCLEIKKRKDDMRKTLILSIEQDIKKQNSKFCGKEEIPNI